MKVYTIQCYQYSDEVTDGEYNLKGVYSSLEIAQKYCPRDEFSITGFKKYKIIEQELIER